MASAESIALTLEAFGEGEPVHLAWDLALAEALAHDEQAGAAGSPWRVEGELDWEEAQALRLISAVFEDGRALAVAALRPRGAPGHDDDAVAHRLIEAGEPVPLAEALLSTEYDAAGRPRRIGLELWPEPESPPLRVAADRRGEVEVDGDGVRRETARMSFRLDGASGTGLYEVLRPA